MQTPNYTAHLIINGYTVRVDVSCNTPEEVVEIVQDLFKEIETKVASIKISDTSTGYFLRGFDK